MVRKARMENYISNKGWTKIREKSGLIFVKLDN